MIFPMVVFLGLRRSGRSWVFFGDWQAQKQKNGHKTLGIMKVAFCIAHVYI